MRRRPGRRARRPRPRHLISAIAGACVALAACSGDDSAEPSTSASAVPSTAVPSTVAVPSTTPVPTTTVEPPTTPDTTTTAAPAPASPAYAEAGPYPVGVTTLSLAEGTPVEVWYPATPPVSGTTGYDVRDYVPPAVRALLTADLPAGIAFDGERDVAIGDGRFPLVVFSHGFSGIRVQSSFLTSHLASWGLVVAAPEHTSRDLTNVLAGTASGDRAAAVDEVARTIDLMTTDARFAGHIDPERVGLVGHSAGGFTVLGAALDDRVDGYVSMASGGPAEGAAFPTVPGLLMAGAVDGVVPLEEVTRPAFDASPPGTWLVVIAATGHNGFDDFCTFGDGRGIIGVAEASGLGPLLHAQPQLRALGVDGCEPPAAPVDRAFPIIRHTTTAFLRHLFGDDATPAIGPDLADAFALEVTADVRPG